MMLQLQKQLARLGYEPGRLDGVWGPKTAAALKAAQNDHGFDVDAVAEINTRGRVAAVDTLVEQARVLVARIADPVWALFPYGTAALRRALDAAMLEGCVYGQRADYFLAQVAHESGGFRWMEEIADGSAYNGRRDLGNHLGPNFGIKYKGRGILQLTGYKNYQRLGELLDLDLADNPKQAAEPAISARVAVAYWTDHNLNALSDRSEFKAVTRSINGGYNGYRDRLKWLQRIQAVRA